MPSNSLSLDILRLRDQKSQLKLCVDTTLHFDNTLVTSSVSSQGSLLDTILCRQCWVARGSFFHLDISVLFNGSSTPSSGFLDRLGQYICGAPVWAQLGLSVTIDSEPIASNRICIFLDHDRYSNNSHVQSGISSRSIADLRPPDKTPVIALEQICIVLDFHTPSTYLSRSKKIDKASLLTSRQGIRDCDSITACNEDAQEFEDSFLTEMLRDEALPIHATYAGSSQLSIHSEAGRHSSQSQPSTACSSAIISQEKASELPFVNEKSACNTVDLAFRMLIGGKQVRRTAGMRCIKPPPAHTLSELAPALFNPGFLKALAERSHLISPLNQALSRSLLVYAQSPFLRQNIQRLNIPVSEPNNLSNNSRIIQDLSHIGKCCPQEVGDRLWQLAQRGLYNNKIVQRLKRSRSNGLAQHGKSGVDVDPDDDFDMLYIEDSPLYGEGQVCFGVAGEDEFEDLLQSDVDDFEGDVMDSFWDNNDSFDSGDTLAISGQLLYRSRATSVMGFDDQGSGGDNSCMLLESDLMIATQSPNPRLGTEESVEIKGQLLEYGDATEHMLV